VLCSDPIGYRDLLNLVGRKDADHHVAADNPVSGVCRPPDKLTCHRRRWFGLQQRVDLRRLAHRVVQNALNYRFCIHAMPLGMPALIID
jgi:hypothetical protein